MIEVIFAKLFRHAQESSTPIWGTTHTVPIRSFTQSPSANRQTNTDALSFLLPPPLPGFAGIPTSRTQQVVHRRLGCEAVVVGEGKREEKKRSKRKDKRREVLEVEVDLLVQMTSRDEAMLAWLGVVRLADMEGVRWALAGLSDAEVDGPVSVRKAQQWVARLMSVGLVARARPTFRDGQIVWATHQAIGRQAPDLYRQTTRHEVAVSTVAARYLAQGYTWTRDRRPQRLTEHQVDGVATKDGRVELVEVELTAKTLHRYQHICAAHASRLADGSVSRIVYFATPDAARAVAREADKFLFRDHRSKLVTLSVFDKRGKWVADDAEPLALSSARAREESAPPLWEQEALR